MSWLFTKVRRDSPENAIEPKDIAVAYIELNRCIDLLNRMINLDLPAT